MLKSFLWCLALALFLLTSCASRPAVSRDVPSGKWSGDYGLEGGRREPISVELRWEDATLRGTVQSGFRSLPITKASFKSDTGDISLEFDAEGNRGQKVHYLIDGKVSGNSMSGSWSHDDQHGDFKVMKE